jgi:hypothetical protein
MQKLAFIERLCKSKLSLLLGEYRRVTEWLFQSLRPWRWASDFYGQMIFIFFSVLATLLSIDCVRRSCVSGWGRTRLHDKPI